MKAKEIYHEEKGHAFKWDLAWEVLCNAPKWINKGAPLIEATPTLAPLDPTSNSPVILYEPERPIGCKAAKKKRVASENKDAEAANRLAVIARGQELMERRIHALEEGNRISAGFLKVEAEAKRTQSIKSDIKILNMKEEDMDDITAIIALHAIKKEVSMKYEQ